ncbi:MAG: RNA polymerase sigma factor [Myxococcales bacterium]|nr:RNA polymerase sigma factor [Myxococcales bacterium]MCB9702955.1 RNA polymerase sigma factor [Myxococcales bacterium]
MPEPRRHLRAVADPPSEPSPAEITAILVERAQRGEMGAWSRLYQDHFAGLYGHLRHLTGDPVVAEELVQETFVQALPKIDRFDGRSTFATWLHGIAINIVRNHWRSRRSTAKAHAGLEAVEAVRPRRGESPDVPFARKQRIAALYAALETLPDHLRLAFILRDLEGLAPEEAAERLGITPNNLAVRACRARDRIRKLLAEGGVIAQEGTR